VLLQNIFQQLTSKPQAAVEFRQAQFQLCQIIVIIAFGAGVGL